MRRSRAASDGLDMQPVESALRRVAKFELTLSAGVSGSAASRVASSSTRTCLREAASRGWQRGWRWSPVGLLARRRGAVGAHGAEADGARPVALQRHGRGVADRGVRARAGGRAGGAHAGGRGARVARGDADVRGAAGVRVWGGRVAGGARRVGGPRGGSAVASVAGAGGGRVGVAGIGRRVLPIDEVACRAAAHRADAAYASRQRHATTELLRRPHALRTQCCATLFGAQGLPAVRGRASHVTYVYSLPEAREPPERCVHHRVVLLVQARCSYGTMGIWHLFNLCSTRLFDTSCTHLGSSEQVYLLESGLTLVDSADEPCSPERRTNTFRLPKPAAWVIGGEAVTHPS